MSEVINSLINHGVKSLACTVKAVDYLFMLDVGFLCDFKTCVFMRPLSCTLLLGQNDQEEMCL